MSVIPLILAGHFEEVGKTFQEAVQPDFDVVYFATSPQAGLADIPVVLKGEIPTSAAATGNKVGSGNLAHGIPRAVVLSGSYDDAFVERLRKAIAAVGKAVPILKLEHSAGATAGAAGGAKPTADKTKAVAERAVKALKKLEDEGKLDGEDDGVYSY
ncbi:hypothetical protein F4820DRAFT_171067 [Hypoxylon rubiginosum]|uniref:Uncharacterized protein n=1 Tax=Hypoxylon rubiginosum TaxID=110542 RepID=A0ACB9Z880_9PEZI|nr:hypothetical protein F4820DRAFT_171067 [Hypoxylon rubiginosum]